MTSAREGAGHRPASRLTMTPSRHTSCGAGAPASIASAEAASTSVFRAHLANARASRRRRPRTTTQPLRCPFPAAPAPP